MNTDQVRGLMCTNDPDGEPSPGHKFFGGFFVKVQHPAGSTRTGTGPDGKAWATQMQNDYGELPGSVGSDGDPVDVYLGAHPEAKLVHVVHMNDANGNYDEDKSYIGFRGQGSVVRSFKHHYGNSGATIGSITVHRVKDFRKKVRLSKKAGGQKLNASK